MAKIVTKDGRVSLQPSMVVSSEYFIQIVGKSAAAESAYSYLTKEQLVSIRDEANNLLGQNSDEPPTSKIDYMRFVEVDQPEVTDGGVEVDGVRFEF